MHRQVLIDGEGSQYLFSLSHLLIWICHLSLINCLTHPCIYPSLSGFHLLPLLLSCPFRPCERLSEGCVFHPYEHMSESGFQEPGWDPVSSQILSTLAGHLGTPRLLAGPWAQGKKGPLQGSPLPSAVVSPRPNLPPSSGQRIFVLVGQGHHLGNSWAGSNALVLGTPTLPLPETEMSPTSGVLTPAMLPWACSGRFSTGCTGGYPVSAKVRSKGDRRDTFCC